MLWPMVSKAAEKTWTVEIQLY